MTISSIGDFLNNNERMLRYKYEDIVGDIDRIDLMYAIYMVGPIRMCEDDIMTCILNGTKYTSQNISYADMHPLTLNVDVSDEYLELPVLKTIHDMGWVLIARQHHGHVTISNVLNTHKTIYCTYCKRHHFRNNKCFSNSTLISNTSVSTCRLVRTNKITNLQIYKGNVIM